MSDRDARRRQILAAAERLFAHYGVRKTTIADVARETGIGVGTVYLEFNSKDALITKVASARHLQILAELEQALAQEESSEARLRALLRTRTRAFLRMADPGMHASDMVHCGCPAVEGAFQRYQMQERALLVRVLGKGIDDGELAPGAPEPLAEALLTAFRAFTPPYVYLQPRQDLERRLQALCDLMLRGLLARG